MAARNRVCVIGLDGATFDVIHPMIAAGQLPHLKRLMAEGVAHELTSVIPPITTTAWTSFMTGKNPGKHGICHFRARPSDIDCLEFTSGAYIGCTTIWETLKDAGVRTIAINVPMTYPLFPVEGIMISGMMTPGENAEFAYPPGIIQEINREVGEYHLDPKVVALGAAAMEEWVKGFFKVEEERAKAIVYLLRNKPWDLAVAIIDITDRVGHLCWRYYRQDGKTTNSPLLREGVEKCYQLADRIVGEILEVLPEDTTVIVMSDHGFGSCEKIFFTNEWLRRQGYLKPRRPTLFNFPRLYCCEVRRTTLENVLIRLGANGLRRFLPRSWLERVLALPFVRRRQSSYSIDWSETKAYGAGLGIYINLRGRQPEGIVPPDQYEQLRDEILQKLRELEDPKTGEKIVTASFKKEEIYSGAFLDEAPDILFGLKDLAYVQVDQLMFGRLFRPSKGGTHRMNGILVMSGKHVNCAATPDQVSILDIAPTLYYLLGLPVPDDMDGRVLLEMLDPAYVRENPVEVRHIDKEDVRKRGELSADEAAELERRLRLLGYIG